MHRSACLPASSFLLCCIVLDLENNNCPKWEDSSNTTWHSAIFHKYKLRLCEDSSLRLFYDVSALVPTFKTQQLEGEAEAGRSVSSKPAWHNGIYLKRKWDTRLLVFWLQIFYLHSTIQYFTCKPRPENFLKERKQMSNSDCSCPLSDEVTFLH